MKVLKAFPPNFSLLKTVFPIAGKQGILYAWGDRLYNPSNVKVTPWIMAHEEVHGERQQDEGMSVEEWWDKYINYEDFRLKEEILAHQAEWKSFIKHWSLPYHCNYLDGMATRLSSPLYGSLISKWNALDAITDKHLSQ